MKFILKYLKKYALLVLLVVGLTYAQVQTELALPDYMSDIVTNGIQYNGITDEVPSIITEDDMSVLFNFVKAEEQLKILDNYTLLNKGDKAVVKNQEVEFKTNTYVIKENHDDLVDIFKMPIIYSYKMDELGLSGFGVKELKENIQIIDDSLIGLEENYSSIVKLHIRDYYANVGLNVEKTQNNYILHLGLVMLGISLVSVLVTVASTYLATKIAAEVAAKMRKDVFEKVQEFSNTEFSTFSTASLITRSGNDITKVQQLIQMMLRLMLMSPIMGITAVFKVARYPSISWLLFVAIGIVIATMIFLLIVAVPKFEVIQKLVDKINGIIREFLDGMLVIRAFNSEKVEENKFDISNKEQTKIDRFISRCMGAAMPIMTIMMNVLTIAIIWFSAPQIDRDVMTIGDMMAFVQYAIHVVMSFMFVSVTFFMVPRSLVSVRRIKEVIDTNITILDSTNPLELPKENGDLCFENVYFKYPGDGEYALEDISFKASPGETVAFIGSTGSGKTTVVSLIPRLFDVSKGRITYCGKDIREVRQKELHDRIGYASQKAILFTGSIKTNIEFGRDLSNDELENAINVSQSSDIIKEKSKGVDEVITQGGTNVSGGQKQRLSIARALAKDKNIYIFDDSFSALDYATDKKLRGELSELIHKTKATVFIVAQRISTIKNADKIIVLEKGKVVGEGSHKNLLENCKVYQEIAYSQLSKEELENARA